MSARAQAWTIVALAAVALLVIGAWALLRPPVIQLPDPAQNGNGGGDAVTRVERPPPASQGYVGSAVCRDCHSEICDSFEMHSMGRATAAIDEVPRIEDFSEGAGFNAAPITGRTFDVRYYVSEEDGEVYHHERATSHDGTVIYDQAVPVHFEVGSGVRGRSYITNREGVLLMSPMSWYSQQSRWDFSPGYRLDNLHFERRVLDGCINCHTGRLARVEEQPDRFDPERPIIEGAISCERCHGPGEEHVSLRQGDLPADAVDPIVNPSKLAPHLRDSVCYQCHLHGAQRIERYGRSDYDFRPGEDFCDTWVVFVRGTGVESGSTTEAVSQSEQMLASQCYQLSEGRLGCASCHDPHSLPDESQRVDFYRSRCLDCHAAGDPPCSQPLEERLAVTASDSCIDCHMPSLAASDVPHTSQTDHRVLRVAQEVIPQDTGNVVAIFREESGAIPEQELIRARALFMVLQAERMDNPAMALEAVAPLQEWLEAAPDDIAAIEALGMALLMGRETNAAITIWERGLELNPEHEDLLRRLMFACHDHGQIDLAVEYGQRLVAVNPWYHDYWGRLAHLLGQQGNFEAGIEAAERALEICPSNAPIRGWLVEAYHRTGDTARAAEQQRLYNYLTAGD